MARLLIGVTGGIAAYKAIETVRLAIAAGHRVRVIQTPASQRFIGAASFQGVTGAPVLVDEFEDDPLRGAYPGEPPGDRAPIAHLALVQRADLYLIAPASANTIAKLAHGHADGLVTTAALAAECPVVVAPAMNDRMYRHPATRSNLERLAARGVTIVGPDEGELASHGERGPGRMSEPAQLLAACERRLADARRADTGPLPSPWLRRRVLVTAGGTQEPIDSVRYIGNRSSGRMGLALAGAAARRGAEVTLVAANVGLSAPEGVRVVTVRTAAELDAACGREFDAADVLLMAAAVSDFRPRDTASQKLSKDDGPPQLRLESTPDVLGGLGRRRRPGQVLVGFAAEHGDGAVVRGRGKLARKGLNAIVVNDISRTGIGFDAVENEVTIIRDDGSELPLPRASKDRIAEGVLDEVEMLLTVNESEARVVGADPHRAAGV